VTDNKALYNLQKEVSDFFEKNQRILNSIKNIEDELKKNRHIGCLDEEIHNELLQDLYLLKRDKIITAIRLKEAKLNLKTQNNNMHNDLIIEKLINGIEPSLFSSLWSRANSSCKSKCEQMKIINERELLIENTKLITLDLVRIEIKLNKFNYECSVTNKNTFNHIDYEWSKRASLAKKIKETELSKLDDAIVFLSGKIKTFMQYSPSSEFIKLCRRSLTKDSFEKICSTSNDNESINICA
jgi:hypothetical protein